jgi:ribosomal protein S18 acetylase RimI-like enzyme
VVSLSVSHPPRHESGSRPVNLKTDLAPLADLIELAFADTMDNGGRAAIREMRAMSRVSPGLGVLPGVNDLVLGIGMGYVWIEDERLIGNVSIYPASLPPESGRAWIIANVAVHPDYRGRGIARRLMNDSLAAIRRRGAGDVILQVETQNWKARELYESLGFREDGAFVTWRRAAAHPPSPLDSGVYITRRGRGEWRSEYALAKAARPQEQGGIGWLRPTVPSLFRTSWRKTITDFFNLRSTERLVTHAPDGHSLNASLWVERAFVSGAIQLTLLLHPYAPESDRRALLLTGVRRFGADNTLVIEHPLPDQGTAALLETLGFRRARTLLHMRWQHP